MHCVYLSVCESVTEPFALVHERMAHLAPHMALLSSGKLIYARAIAGNAVNAAPNGFALLNHPAPHSRSSAMIRRNLVFHLASTGKVGIHLASRHSGVDDKQQYGKDLAFAYAKMLQDLRRTRTRHRRFGRRRGTCAPTAGYMYFEA